jgi:hydrogenase maturation protease
MDEIRRLADTVLYEGYILWPYRRSATKNQRRWTFGGIFPPQHSEAHPDDRSELRAECLLEADEGTAVNVSVRFLQVVERCVARNGEPVDELMVDGVRHLSWDEAVERETVVAFRPAERQVTVGIAIAAGSETEQIGDGGAIVRTWEPLRGTVELSCDRLGDRLFRLTARLANETPWAGDDREDALRSTFCSAHVVLETADGAFVSLTDPPEELREEAEACTNVGVWPVLVGAEGDRHTLLAAPIILSDYPQIAPESPGDFFDATEIDRMLIMNVLSLTEAEQAEMRATDPRAREILDRCAELGPEELLPLHGAVRELRES